MVLSWCPLVVGYIFSNKVWDAFHDQVGVQFWAIYINYEPRMSRTRVPIALRNCSHNFLYKNLDNKVRDE